MGCIPSKIEDYNNIPLFSFKNVYTKGYITEVYDGDTVTIVFKYHNELIKVKCRLYGINCPEIRTRDMREKEEGLLSRDYLRTLILHKWIYIKLDKFDNFGRTLGLLFLNNVNPQEKDLFKLSINNHLVINNFAKLY